MSYRLLMDDADNNWQLHVSEDPELLRIRLENTDADVVQVSTVLADQLEPVTLNVRPRNLGWWALIEISDPDA